MLVSDEVGTAGTLKLPSDEPIEERSLDLQLDWDMLNMLVSLFEPT